jgi:hypothetical protein|tara:strand:+ start:1672 stop:1908 length:237 start_codon:yes stop_codon:yes gene_type:complete
MNIKKDIREKLSKYLDTKLERGDPYIFNDVVNFIKKDRKEQLILQGVSGCENYVVITPEGKQISVEEYMGTEDYDSKL